jgi:hypothetical protein
VLVRVAGGDTANAGTGAHRNEQSGALRAPNPGCGSADAEEIREASGRQAAAGVKRAGSDDQGKHQADRHDGDDGGDQGLGQGVDHARFEEDGSPGRARTADPVINSHLLYRLSYRGKEGA